MDGPDWLSERFEANRNRLRSMAYRMLGSVSDADDALQEAWIRLQRSDADGISNLEGWLTTVVSRISLNMLRDRQVRREGPHWAEMPDPLITDVDADDPEQQVLIADSVGTAMLVVLETLTPGERLAFVLHDVFGVSYFEIARMIGCSEVAARQLASRARRRVRGTPTPDADLPAQRNVVDAFFTAARTGRLDDLVAVLHSNVVLRVDPGPQAAAGHRVARGAPDVAARARSFASPSRRVVPVVVNGAAGAVIVTDERPFSVMGFTVVGGKIAAIDVLADPDRVDRLCRGSAVLDSRQDLRDRRLAGDEG